MHSSSHFHIFHLFRNIRLSATMFAHSRNLSSLTKEILLNSEYSPWRRLHRLRRGEARFACVFAKIHRVSINFVKCWRRTWWHIIALASASRRPQKQLIEKGSYHSSWIIWRPFRGRGHFFGTIGIPKIGVTLKKGFVSQHKLNTKSIRVVVGCDGNRNRSLNFPY